MMDDLISRAAAIARIDKCVALSGIGLEPVMAIRDVKALISVLPAVDAASVVHGRWIYEDDDPAMIPCSVCGYRVFRYNNTPHCPNCGAKMDGGMNDGRETDPL